MTSERVDKFWRDFCEESSVDPSLPYQVWSFGNTTEMALQLVSLVISGKKIATTALEAVHKITPDEAPIDDGYSVVTDHDGAPMCVIQTTEIRHLPFNEVDPEFAADEGEGDRTLESWRNAHRRYFERESADLGIEFTETSLVCCERFRLLFPK